MSLLMKALKQAERDHDEAIKTVIDPDTKTDLASADSVDEGFELSLSNQSDAKSEHSEAIDSVPHTHDTQASLTTDSTEAEFEQFEQFESGQIDDAIDRHYGEQPDLSRHSAQREAPLTTDTASLDYPHEEVEPSTTVDDHSTELGMADELDQSDDVGLELDLNDTVDSEQTLIDTSNEGAFLGTAKLATVKKRPTVFRKLIAGLSLAVLAIVGAGWYALELLHIPSPPSEPVLGPTTVRTVQSASSRLSDSLAKTDFQSTASVGAVAEQPLQLNKQQTKPSAPSSANATNAGQGSSTQTATIQAEQSSAASANNAAPARKVALTSSAAAAAAPAAPARTRAAKSKKITLKSSLANQSVPAPLNPGAKPEIEFRKVTNAQEQQTELLNNAYAALRANDDEKASQLYRQALANDQLSTDVWVGLATLAVRRGDVTKARQAYENALRINPNDSVAIAGRLSLQGEGDALSQESRYRTLLAANPNDAALQFALASTLAAQDRWVDAQKAYFNAASAAPSHPDYAFNLAVSLEHIRQPAIALQYYSRALDLAANHQPEFDLSMAEQRIKALQSNLGRN